MRIQKGKPVFGRNDTIDFDTLGEIIHAWLVRFRDCYIQYEHCSVPCDIAEEYPDNAQEKYLEIIDKMIYAFADDEPEYSGRISMESGEPLDNGMIPFDIQVSDAVAWGRYIDECREHEQRVQEGLELFGKYFRSLWV